MSLERIAPGASASDPLKGYAVEEFIHCENLKLFKRQLALAKDDARRQLLLRLLAEEEAPVATR
jgi:hypothetical protein